MWNPFKRRKVYVEPELPPIKVHLGSWPNSDIQVVHTHRYERRPRPDAVEVSLIDPRGYAIRSPIAREIPPDGGSIVQYYFYDLGVSYALEGYSALPEDWRDIRLDIRTIYR